MYVDLAPDRQSCIWTPSMWLTLSHVVSMEVIVAMMVMVMKNRMKFTLDNTIIPLPATPVISGDYCYDHCNDDDDDDQHDYHHYNH